MSNPETALKAAVIEAINATGLAVVWSTPSGKVPTRGGWVQLAPVGTPDVIGFMRRSGLLVAVEVKLPKDTTAVERRLLQGAWRDRAAAAGCVVGVARSVAEAVEIVQRGCPLLARKGA